MTFMLHLNFKAQLYIYSFLCLYAVERSVFALTVLRGIKTHSSAWLTYMPFLSYIVLCFVSIIEFFLLTNKVVNLIISVMGIFILVGGIFLRYQAIWAFRVNEQKWNSHVDADSINILITTGIYKFVRHPYYFSVMLELCGIALLLNTFRSLIFIFLIQAPLLCKRIIVEDSALSGKFGRQYILYKKQARTILPNWSAKK